MVADTSKRARRSGSALVVNSLSTWVVVAASTITGILITPLILDDLGKEANGLWRLAVQLIGYYGLIDFSLGLAVIRYLSKYRGEGRDDDFRRTFQTALAMCLMFGAGLVVLSTVFGGRLGELLTSDPTLHFGPVIRILALAAAMNALNLVTASVLISFEEMTVMNMLRAGAEVARGALSLLVIASGGGLIGLAWVWVGVAVVNFVALIAVAEYRHRALIRPAFGFSRQMFAKLTRFAMIAMVSQGGDILRTQVDLVVISAVVSLEAAGVYAVVLVIVRVIRGFVIATADVTRPRLGAVQSDREHFQRSTMLYTNIIACLTVLVVAPLWVTIDDLLRVWLGTGTDLTPDDFATASVVFRILAVGATAELLLSVTQKALEMLNRQAPLAVMNVSEGVANLALSIGLGAWLGLEGVALGTAIPAVVARLFVQPRFVSSIIHLDRGRLVREGIVRPALVLVVVAVATAALQTPIGADSVGQLALLGLASGIVTAGLVWFIGLTAESRSVLTQFVAGFRRHRAVA